MNNLLLYGWSQLLLQQKQASNYKDFMHGRVSTTHRTCYEVVAEDGFYTCELTGNMLYSRDPNDYPTTGDWVIFQTISPGKGLILDMLPRQKSLSRLKNGTVAEKQTIASHIDKAFIVQSLDSNFNVRRTERFVLRVIAEGILPALVLTKTDLGFNGIEVENSLKHLSHKIPVFYTTVHDPSSIDKLREFILQGETVVFTGSSGVGKSTLINALCRQEVFATAAISESTGKGRHTTTRREMVLMDQAGVLIDTPGVKVFGVTNDNAETLSEMMDFGELELKCQFKDCKHINEKGCAVIKAVENGEIDRGVYENYLKLRQEAWHYTASVHEKRKREKSFSKMVKQYKNRSYKDNI